MKYKRKNQLIKHKNLRFNMANWKKNQNYTNLKQLNFPTRS